LKLFTAKWKAMNKLIIGIDPGASGAIATLQGKKLIDVIDMPIVQRTVGKAVKNFVSPHELHTHLAAYLIDYECTAYIEQVSAMPGQGVSSMFSFGRSLGNVEGVLASLQIPYHFVPPLVWQRKVRLTGGKDGARALAQQMFPNNASSFSRKRDDGRADASLIALYGVMNEHTGS
jgi:crossover junction endodeoxyribonuclease RuvC